MAEHPGLFKPFLSVFGLKASDVKNRTVIDSVADRVGQPILKIGNWKPDSKEAICRILTKTEMYQEKKQVRIARFMKAELEDVDDEDVDDEESPF